MLENKTDLNPLISVHVDEAVRLEHVKAGDARATNFVLKDSISEADIYCLPKIWGYYLKNGLIQEATTAVNRAINLNLPVLVFSQGDPPARLPFSGVHVFENAGYKSNSNLDGNKHYGYPAIIRDYVRLFDLNQLEYRGQKDKPTIGFCGQASGGYLEYGWHELKRRYKNHLYKTGRTVYEPPPFETVFFRNRVLSTLKKHLGIQTDYILRKQYRAGNKADMKKPTHQVRREFVQNILNTDYTVCMRGGGNYSVRFYETLCLGRIPIFVNTDCLLPFDEEINYKELFVWVEEREIRSIGDKVLQFHKRLSPSEFINVQHKCRDLWVSNFSTGGYYSKFAELISRIIKNGQ